MKLLVGSCLLFGALASIAAACSTPSSPDEEETSHAELNGVPVGEVRGVVDVSNTIRTRLLDDTDPGAATFDVSRVPGDALFALRGHLGTFAQVGTTAEYQGGLPTPFSAALWHQVFGRFADAMGARCGSTSPGLAFPAYTKTNLGLGSGAGITIRLAPSVAQKVDAACAFEGDEAARRKTATALFDAVMGRGGSLAAERAAFEAEFGANPDYVGMAPSERVKSMIYVMVFNPYFLLAN